MNSDWYVIQNIEDVDSPSIALYKDHLMFNIHKMIAMVDGNTTKLTPHIKTNKMPKVIEQMILSGIKNFKASTISEAEIAAHAGASSVLIAHQLVGPKIQRFAALTSHFSNTKFSTLVDNLTTVKKLNEEAAKNKIKISVFIDINNGMNRSGIEIGDGLNELLKKLPKYTNLIFEGLHAYDGHLRDSDINTRKNKVEQGMADVVMLYEELKEKKTDIKLVCGGTPSFTSHLINSERICSPGTCLLWDWGYDEKLTEQEFKFAALLITRVISKPTEGIVTIDLGHKSVASENPIDKRVKFLNLDRYQLISQSEEHGVLQVDNWEEIRVGDVLYGIPYHICPSINLHDDVSVIVNGLKVDNWEITARKRKISI
ncbi:D-TA family PLP-dependent enzyme [Flavobacteriaceae bacterium R38]|nr:D-TA family PLP-dependent enzyme [Flavobacteriaceae bacterium R38]